MLILLTRAGADAERTAARLAALGHASIISPVIETIATGARLPSGRFDAIIATSAHAFIGGTRALADVPLYAVGERTREAAQRSGWTAPIHVDENAKALMAALRADLQEGRHVLYLAGRDRKADVETAAQAIGLKLAVVETYAARPISTPTEDAERALRDGEIDAVLHYSRRSAELFIAMARQAALWHDAAQVRHYALSGDAAEPLIAAGAQACIAAKPDEDHLIALLAADEGDAPCARSTAAAAIRRGSR